MTDGFTKIETALLDSLERERALLRQRDLVNGMVLHEIANAVTVVAGGLELLQHNRSGTSTHGFAVEQIHRGAAVMIEMIRGLRVLTESTGDSPAYVRGNLPAFVRNIVTDPFLIGTNLVDRVNVIVRGSQKPTLYCATLLRHALSNLVRNALKYSLSDTKVTVIVGSRREKRWIHVLNRGTKLDPAVARHIFEPGKKNAKGGMGFGLHIT